MTTKAERRVPLPDGLVPLLNQRQLETFYGVSETKVLRWIKAGMPVELMAPVDVPSESGPQRIHRRFDLEAVRAWHAEQMQACA